MPGRVRLDGVRAGQARDERHHVGHVDVPADGAVALRSVEQLTHGATESPSSFQQLVGPGQRVTDGVEQTAVPVECREEHDQLGPESVARAPIAVVDERTQVADESLQPGQRGSDGELLLAPEVPVDRAGPDPGGLSEVAHRQVEAAFCEQVPRDLQEVSAVPECVTARWTALRHAPTITGMSIPFSSRASLDAARAAPATGPLLAALLIAGTTYAFTQLAVSPALPGLADALDVPVSTASWLLTAFLLASSVATPVIGKLGDVFERGRVLVVVLVLFAAGSLLCALSSSFELTLLGRVVQGTAGGVFPLAYGLVRDRFPADRRAGAFALLATTFGVGGGLGLPLSGVLAEAGDVRYVFLSGLIALPVAVAVWFLCPPDRAPGVRRSLDPVGCLVLGVGLFLLLLGLSRAGALGPLAPQVVGLVLSGLAVLALFVKVELRQGEPLVDVRVLRQRPLLMTNASTLLMGITLFTSFLLTPLYAQTAPDAGYGFGFSATAAGLLMLPSSLTMLVAGPVSGMLMKRFGARVLLITGGLTGAASTGLLAVERDRVADFVIAGIAMGIGTSLSLVSGATLVVHLSRPEDVGVATGINNVARTVGAALGSVLLASCLAASVPDGAVTPTDGGFTAAYALGCLAALASTGLAFAIPRRRKTRLAADAAAPSEQPAPALT